MTPPPAAIVLPATEKPQGETAVLATIPPSPSQQSTPTALPLSTPIPTPQTTPIPSPTAASPTFNNTQNDTIAASAIANGVTYTLLNSENTGIRQYDKNLFFHPIALEVWQQTAYLLAAGRVLAFNLTTPSLPANLLSPGEKIDGVTVLEPLDLAVTATGLLVLDRAGDVYGYDWQTKTWQVDRYDRPIGESSGHYYVAVAGEENGRYLLETNYQYVRLYGENLLPRLWPLIESRAVDMAVQDEEVYVLTQEMHNQTGILAKYRDTAYISAFQPTIEIVQPREVVVTETAVFVLDMAGRRLLTLDKRTGQLLQIMQTPPGTSAFWADPTDNELLLAASDRLYLINRPQERLYLPGGPTLSTEFMSAGEWIAALSNFIVPIQATDITQRDFQMPGAPRHYRLGIHQGLDFYWRPGTQIRAAADGVVIRAMHDYQPPTAELFANLQAATGQIGYTSAAIIDIYRGRQVWIQHENGVVSRYIHLRSIDPAITVGAVVSQGRLIGEVGNSGSPSSIKSETADSHLHFELWQGAATYLGQYLRPIETRHLIEFLFHDS